MSSPAACQAGAVVVGFQQLDCCAEHMLGGFVAHDDVGLLPCAGENTSWKLDKLAAIASEMVSDPEVKAALLGWVKASRDLVTRRNKLMHSVYTVEPERNLTHRWKSGTRGGKWHGEREQIELEDLTEYADLLDEGAEAARLIMAALAESGQWFGYGTWRRSASS